MTADARITVTAGPDRGKSCALTGELTRVGRGPENDLVLSDSSLADHLASIVHREGRYAIITTVAGGLEIDGTEVPVERWVWLPDMAQIRVSRRTALEFVTNGSSEKSSAGEEPTVDATAADTRRAPGAGSSVVPKGTRPAARRPAGDPPGSSGEVPRAKRTTADRAEKKARQVAKFITDGPGDPLVKLGEDGHLPELMLKEGQVIREGREQQAKQTNPVVLVLAVGASVGMTLLMLLMDSGGYGDNTASKAAARVEIADYYGTEDETLKPYQIYLRQARQARARGDFEAERSEYRKVLRLLRSEAKEKIYKYTGLTGRLDYPEGDAEKQSDRRLEELIAILLSE